MIKRILLLSFLLLLTYQSIYAQYRTRYNELSIRWAKTLFIEPPLFHFVNAFPIGLHYTRHFDNGHGFQVEIGGEFDDLFRNQGFYMKKDPNKVAPYLRVFADGSLKWMFPIYRKKSFRLHAIGGLTYRKMWVAYGDPGGDLLVGVFSDLIGSQAGFKATLNLGRFFVVGLSQECGAFYHFGGNGIPKQQRSFYYVGSPVNFTTRLSLGLSF